MATIARGTTPSLIVDFSDVSEFSVSDITAVSLVIKRRTERIEYGLSDMIVSGDACEYGEKMKTLLSILSTYTQYDGSPTAHADVLKTLKSRGYK